MRLAVPVIVILSLGVLSGCMGSGQSITWSKNIAMQATAKDSGYNDDNIHTTGETGPIISESKDAVSVEETDKYTQALLEWGRPQPVQKIVIKADEGELEFFEVQYYDDEASDWQVLRSVKNNLKTEYKLQLNEPITTRRLRLKVPRQWDSRRIGGQKRATRGEGGAPTGSYRKIRDIEVYYAMTPEETPANE